MRKIFVVQGGGMSNTKNFEFMRVPDFPWRMTAIGNIYC
jgi:hypothetical protein